MIGCQGDSEADYYPLIIYSNLSECTTSLAVLSIGCSSGLLTSSFDVRCDIRGLISCAISCLVHNYVLIEFMSLIGL